ncbi:uncharacterized protein N0V89_004020 [Didymosphaeria variabile]|uniref:Succinate dehydrogenase assembly factor 4, mitochondrial n=1 Tax=Didymosphaeria variabile TaxID=1932322 RepID=A0A9W8XNP2_9PLEO|nr:uncharacterized protein N0V89_004020 [Didymosphaeria variabile]KAJ4355995.1 hypothetical protein N0V89_004020 [Didymosphaeria variabile]
MQSSRTILRVPRHLSHRAIPFRALSTTAPRPSSPFTKAPAPPRLPKEEQEIFERLQKQSTGAFSTPRDEAAATSTSTTFSAADVRARINQSPDSEPVDAKRIPEGEEVHPNLRRGAPPEFEGDVNPKTGEVGGPKVEPLRWGAAGDYSFNGRVTDF